MVCFLHNKSPAGWCFLVTRYIISIYIFTFIDLHEYIYIYKCIYVNKCYIIWGRCFVTNRKTFPLSGPLYIYIFIYRYWTHIEIFVNQQYFYIIHKYTYIYIVLTILGFIYIYVGNRSHRNRLLHKLLLRCIVFFGGHVSWKDDVFPVLIM